MTIQQILKHVRTVLINVIVHLQVNNQDDMMEWQDCDTSELFFPLPENQIRVKEHVLHGESTVSHQSTTSYI